MIYGSPETTLSETHENSHGGRGSYFVRTLLDGTPAQGFRYMRDLTLEPGSSIGMHPHEDDEEIYFVITGEGLMQVDDEQRVLVPGSVCLTPAGSTHGLRNEGTEKLRIFVACAHVCREHRRKEGES